jgi:hypothetical protein
VRLGLLSIRSRINQVAEQPTPEPATIQPSQSGMAGAFTDVLAESSCGQEKTATQYNGAIWRGWIILIWNLELVGTAGQNRKLLYHLIRCDS